MEMFKQKQANQYSKGRRGGVVEDKVGEIQDIFLGSSAHLLSVWILGMRSRDKSNTPPKIFP